MTGLRGQERRSCGFSLAALEKLCERGSTFWTLETKKAVDGQRVGKGHRRLREGRGGDSGDGFCG